MLWVGLGAPKQEKWIAENLDKLHNINVVFGVGAAFDYHAGVVKWAPTWIRSIGLEWAYRFVQQPRRLLNRIKSGNLPTDSPFKGSCC
jgi:N-acetylglucosaminyldiphosphoundecaprenol N-acetyl-beta-D-mannosaminyltransferase